MITVLIVAVLALVALPTYQRQIAKGRRSDAVNALSMILQAQERLRSNRSSYNNNLSDPALGLPFVNDKSLNGHYALSLAGVGNPASFSFGFIASAVPSATSPQTNDSDCAVMTMQLSGGNLTYGATDSVGNSSTQKCWPR